MIPLLQYVQIIALGITQHMPLLLASISSLERHLAAMFHASTTMFLAYSYKIDSR